jgi:epsilon-lactone hydrolase
LPSGSTSAPSGSVRPQPPVPTSVSDEARRYLESNTYEPSTFPALDDVEAWRQLIAEGDAEIAERFGGFDLPIVANDLIIGGVRTDVLRAPHVDDAPDGPVYLSFHGGALVMGGSDLSRMMGSVVALSSGMITWAPDYRMPPLHPYPAALDDAVAVYRALLDQRAPQDIVVGGASAGGNLAAALLVRAKDEGIPMPGALMLITPEVDLTESGDSFQTNLGIDNVLGLLAPVNRLYANGHDLAHPYLSPLFGDLSGFPPTYLQAGTRDLFLSNTVRMHRKLRAAGVEAELHVFEAMPHGGFGGPTPEDLEAQAEQRRFLDRHLGAR